MENYLEILSVSLRYGRVRALFDISFSLAQGEMMAVVGPNGAGKSSLARAIAGLVPLDAGTIRFDGKTISGRPSHLIQRTGIVYVPEGRGIFRSLTVEENLLMATRHLATRAAKRQAADAACETFPALASRRKQRAGTLSGGEQQMLALARSYTMDAKLLIADELSLGLAPLLVDQVFDSLQRANSEGTTVLIIEQFVDRVLSFADRCLILTSGAVNWMGSAADARAVVGERYLGSSGRAAATPE